MFSHLNEPKFLKNLTKYNFVPQLISSFQDYDFLYLVTTFYQGKYLHTFRMDNMTEEQIKFASACIIQGLECLRKENIIHRDISPVNIIMDDKRYFNLIDFSFSIEYKNKDVKEFYMNTFDMVTPPEMLENKKYDFNSDYYRLGSIIYFLIFKEYPLISKKKKNITDIFVDFKTIDNYTKDCIDFMNKLLTSNYKERIGFKDINELKNHSWFNGFDWIKLNDKKIKSPFRFIKNEINQSRCTRLALISKELSGFKLYSKTDIYNKLIANFNFSNKDIIEKRIKYTSNINN